MKNVLSVNMMGVVIYISADRSRAIIWCEDHGPLAYIRADKAFRENAEIAVGDCVRFQARTDGDFRIGRDIRAISLPPVSGLAQALVARAPVQQKLRRAENVLFPEFTKQRRSA